MSIHWTAEAATRELMAVLPLPRPHGSAAITAALSEVGQVDYHQAQSRMLVRLILLLEKLSAEEMDAVQITWSALHRVLSIETEEK
jgi:hypothetical protein